MAQATPDLTEDQIEQLLSAAENSLPDKPAAKAIKTKQQSQAPAASTSTTSTAQPAFGGADKDVVLRVPQLRSKEKNVCHTPVCITQCSS